MFNILDARGAISVTERVGVIGAEPGDVRETDDPSILCPKSGAGKRTGRPTPRLGGRDVGPSDRERAGV